MRPAEAVLASLSVAVLLLAAMQAQAQLGVIPGISGSTFNLSTGTGHITTPDGDSLLIWGYGSGIAQYPGPTLIVNQGDTVTINLTNNLPKPMHWERPFANIKQRHPLLIKFVVHNIIITKFCHSGFSTS